MIVRTMRRVSLAAATAFSLSMTLPASAFDIVYDPTNYAQNVLTAARALQQIENQVTALANQAQMLANQAKNLQNLKTSTQPQIQSQAQNTQSLLSSVQMLAPDVQRIEAAFSGTGVGLAVNKGKEMAGRAADSMRASYWSGQAAAWKATGGKNEVGVGKTEAANDPSNGPAASSAPPAWASRMRRSQTAHHGASTTAHSIRAGDHGGGSMSVSLDQDDRK